MNSRAVAIQGGLAVAALAAAYHTWQRDPEQSSGDALVLDITKNDLEKVRYEDQEAKTWAELSKGKDTPSGHWEIAGLLVPFDWGYFPRTVPCFPDALTTEFCRRAGLPGR